MQPKRIFCRIDQATENRHKLIYAFLTNMEIRRIKSKEKEMENDEKDYEGFFREQVEAFV